jgi:uroporphyrinogen-III synthase
MPAMQASPTRQARGADAPQLVVTRAREPQADAEASTLELELAAAGVRVHEFALIHVLPAAEPLSAQRAVQALEDFHLAVPVSPSAVQALLRLRDRPWPAACAVGLIGRASRETFETALRERGEDAQGLRLLCAQQAGADSEALWQELQALRGAWQGARVLILRGDGGRDWLAATLQAAGAEVQVVELYRRAAPAADAATLERLRALLGLRAAWQVGAASSLHNLCELLRAAGMDPRRELAVQRALVHHPRVAEAARKAGFGRVDVVEFRAGALLRALS